MSLDEKLIEQCNQLMEHIDANYSTILLEDYSIYGSYFSGEVYTFNKNHKIHYKTKIPTMNYRFRHFLMYREIEKHLVKLLK